MHDFTMIQINHNPKNQPVTLPGMGFWQLEIRK
jgi:hypothetical protein